MCAQKLAPVHPGEVLLAEFLKPIALDVAEDELADRLEREVRPRLEMG